MARRARPTRRGGSEPKYCRPPSGVKSAPRILNLPEAEDELSAAVEWYESRRTGLGVELMAAVDEA